MSARKLLGAVLACAALAGAWHAVRGGGSDAMAGRAAAAPRTEAGAVARPDGVLLAVAPQAMEPQGGGAPRDTAVRRLAYSAALPDSAGRAIAERWCLLCHSAMLVTQQAKDSTAWEKTLAQMEKWGVVVTPEEHDTLRTYLVRSFGPRVKPAPARQAASATAAGDTTRAPSAPR